MSSNPFPVSDGITQVTALGLVLVVLFVSGRLVANLRLHRCLYLDDYAAVAGFVLFVTYAGLCFGLDLYARYGEAAGSYDPTAPFFLKTIYAAEVLAAPASLAAKASVLLLYLRIFNPSPRLRSNVAVVAGLAGLFALPSLPVFSFYCAPNASVTAWTPSIATRCASANVWAAVQQTADAVLNLVMLVLPLPSIFRLHLSIKRRLLLAFVLMHGVFALAASITAAVFRLQLARLPSGDAASILWFRSATFTAFAVELGMTLVSGSFHACWGFARAAHARLTSRNGSRGAAYYSDRSGSGEKMAPSSGGHSAGLRSRRDSDADRAASRHGPAAVPRRWDVEYAAARPPSATPAPTAMAQPDDRKAPGHSTMPRPPFPAALSDAPPSPSNRHSAPSPLPAEDEILPAPLHAPQSLVPGPPSPSAPLYTSSRGFPPRTTSSAAPAAARAVPHDFMSDIEATVAAAGAARLLVGHARPASGASFDEVRVLGGGLGRAFPLVEQREYVVEMAGRDYVAGKAEGRGRVAGRGEGR